MKTLLLTGAAAAAMAAWSATGASAATTAYCYSFSSAQPCLGGANGPDIFDVSAGFISPFGISPATVTQGANGLGVQSPNEADGSAGAGTIDGNPLLTSEYLTVAFDYAVDLDNFTLFEFENGDDYTVLLQTLTGPVIELSSLAFNAIDVDDVLSFTIFAVGVPLVDGLRGNDEFTLKGFQITTELAAVPLPAGAALLIGALGMLGAARRRRA